MAAPPPSGAPSVSPSMAASVALLVVAMSSIQGGAAVASTLFPIAGPAGVVALRLVFGAAMLSVALRIWRSVPTGADWKPVLAYGVSLGLMNLCFYESLARIPLGIAVALEFTGPLALAAYSSRKPLDLLWVALAVGGLLLLTPLAGAADLDPLGVMFGLLAGVFWAGYIVSGQAAGARLGVPAAAWGSLVAAALVAPFGLIHVGAGLLDPNLIFPAMAVALLSTACPYALEMLVMGRMDVRVFGVLMSLEPAIGAFSGWFFLHQALTGQQMLAVSAVIAASSGVAVTARRAAPDG